jgi:hypothetical protein
MFVMAGTVMISVSKMTFIPFASLMNLKMRVMRRARMKVVEEPKSTSIVREMMVEIIEDITITKSKILPVSRK